MNILRNFFLACSKSEWLRDGATRSGFMRRAVSRFMPGEEASDALAAAVALRERSLETVLTHLGENVSEPAEAERVTNHYLGLLDRIREMGLGTEISVKLTQLGLDLGMELCYASLKRVIEHAGPNTMVWIDMEASPYVDSTLTLYRRARTAYPNVGVCVQAYLYRTAKDVESLIPMGAAIRLVKGAYLEPPSIAFPRKKDVDENYFALVKQLLGDQARSAGVRAAIATHDLKLIRRVIEFAESRNIQKSSYEFQMLYGVQREEQHRLAHESWKARVLISYGSYWFPWYMRRLAERPANVSFVLRSMFAG